MDKEPLFGSVPEENTLSDIVLLCNGLLRREIEEGRIAVPADERIRVPKEQFRNLVENCKTEYGKGFSKQYREMSTGEFCRMVRAHMIQMEWIEEQGDYIWIRPVMGKITGRYPKDFKTGGSNE